MIIITNPPYDGSLHLKILDKVIKACPNAEIVNLSPIRWAIDPSAKWKSCSGLKDASVNLIKAHTKSIDIITREEMGKYFETGQAAACAIYYVTKDGGFDFSQYENKIFDKIMAKTGDATILNNLQKNAEKYCIKIPHVYGYISSSVKEAKYITLNKEASFSNEVDSERTRWLNFATEEERNNCFDYFFTNFFKYITFITKTSLNMVKILPFMPTYAHSWTDEMLYEYFGLTPDEIKEIEKCLL